MLLNKIHNLVKLSFVALKLLVELLMNSCVNRKKSLITNKLVVGIKSLLDIFNAEVLDFLENNGIGVRRFISELGLTYLVNDTLNEFNDFLFSS